MSYQKSVALLSCCLMFSISFANLALTSVTGTPSGFESGMSRVKTSAAPSTASLTLPPDTEGPTLTITPPSDVNLTGCYSDFTYSIAAMGKPGYVAYDDCGTATVTETISDTYVYCTDADDATPEGGLTILREFSYLAVDCFGNETEESVIQTITVTDNSAPSFNETLPADITVDCGSIPTAAVLTATDDCDSDANVSYTETSSTTCAGLVRTWVAVDDCGNTTTHVQNITVTDTEDPVISGTPSDITQTADAGDCGAVVTWTAPTATDNCTLDTFTSTHDSGDFFDVGTTTVSYTATDDCGNSTTTSFDITITDDEAPTISGMPANMTQTADAGECDTAVTWTAPTTADNCSAVMTSTHSPGDSFEVGTTTVTYTSVDPSGNTTSLSFTVTVTDDEDPAIAGNPGNLTQTADAGQCSALVSWTAPTATDNCAISTFTSTHNSNDAFAVGTTTVTYTATDIHGNSSTISFDVTVTDDEDPTISGMPANITQTADAGECQALVSWTAPTSADNCSVDTFTSDHSSGDAFPVGTTTVTYTATDIHGNSSTASFTITVTDNEAPVISGNPGDMTASNDAGNCSAVVTWTAPTAADNCSVDTFTSDYSSGDTFPVGTTTVTYTATDIHGNTSTSSFTVTVTDDEDPTIADMPSDVSVNNDAGDCSAEITWTAPTSADNCSVDTFTSDHSSGDAFPVGTTTVTYTATDIHGNSSTASFTITVTDNEAPVISGNPGDMTASNDAGNCSAVVTWTAPTAADNCSVDTFTSDYSSGDTFPVGTTTVTYTATDIHGNSSTISFDVTVTDDEGPVISGNPGDLTASNDSGNCSAEVDWTVPTAGDNCAMQSLTSDHDPMDDFPVGTTTVTYTATDIHGNSSTISFDVTVTDDEDPTISGMPANITQTADAGECQALVSWTAPTSADNCSVDTFTSDHSSGDAFPVGTTTVTYTATDIHGNSSTASFTITVTDDEYPVISDMPPPTIILSNDAGNCSAVVTWTAPTAADNCSVDTFTSDYSSGDTFPVGTTTVTYTAIDGSNNTVSASFNVVVIDDEDPAIANVPTNISATTDNDACGATVTWTAPTASDNCGVTSFPSTHDSGDFFNVGSTTVSYSAMDAAGNGVTSSFTVTVTDGQAPTIDGLPADISVSNDPGQCAAVVTWTEPSATDNCGVTSFSSDETNGASYPVGTTTVTYTAEDAQGNQTTASFNITVTDGENPVFSGTPADITVNNDAGVCSAAVSWAAPTATDNCGATVTSTHNPGASFNVGTTTVTYTATDAANNSVTTSFTVTVVDNESPTIAGNPGDLSASNDAGNCSAAVSWTAPTASDNCSQTLTSTHSPGDTFAVGTTTVTYTSTDAANNTATISFNVVVTDTEAPVISAMSDMTVSTDPGTCDAVVTFTDPAATDNCAISTLTADIASGSTFSLGTTTVTYTATDIHGNSSTASFDVIVEDDEAPAIGTPAADESVECNGSGNTAALMAWLSNNAGAAATDNCSGVTWSNDFTTMANTCGGAGAVQVIFTATDAAGNTSSTSATFTIEDTTAPTFTTPASDLTVECDGAGNTSDLNTWLANFAGATANDDCSSASFSHNYGTGAIMSDLCGATGSVTVTFTATDVCGNESTTSATFTIQDTTNPTALAKDHTVTLNASGNGTMVAGDIDNGSSDGCSTVTLAASQTSFTCADLGPNTITLTVTDDCNNASTTTAIVTVVDNTAPTITAAAADATYECDGTDYSTQFADWLSSNGGATATDACGGLVWTNNSTGLVPGCGDSESEQVTFTVTDGSGNSSTTTATFTVSDTTPPSIASEAIDITLECDGTGNTVELNAWLLANGGAGEATDLCGNVTWSHNFDDYALTCAGTGAVEVIFSATDDCGNAATTTAMFEIVDTTAPALTSTASDRTVECGSSNAADLSGWLSSNGGATADELCGTVTWTNDFTALSDECGNTGSATVTFTATDDCGNAMTTIATYTIEDTTSPIALGADLTVILDGNGQATITPEDIDNGSNDACGDVSLSIDVSSFDCDDVGPNDVVLTVTDDCANSASATVTVIVTAVDDTAPTISDVPADITQTADAGTCGAVVTYASPLTADNCDGGTLTSSHPSGSTFPVGTTTVTFTATDASSNSSTATFTITVTDDEAPTISAQADLSANNDGGLCNAVVSWTEPTSGDNCGVTSFTSTHNSGDAFAVGTTTVTYTAEDAAGNQTTMSFDVVVTDNENPTIAGTPADITQTADAGLCSAVVTWTAATASDNCALATLTSDYSIGDAFPVGTTTVTYTATDIHGNTATSTFDITVTDNEAPALANVPSDITQTADAGQCGAVVDWEFDALTDTNNPVTASDNCAVASLTSNHDNGDTFSVGTTTVTFTAMDIHGNVTTASFDVTITDDENPAIANTPADITQTNDAGNCSAAVTWTEPTSSDNCAVTSFTSTHSPGATFAVGTTTVTYTALDAAGNSTTSSFTVTVTDDENPVISGTPADINQANDLGLCSAVVTWTAPTADDNCGIATLTSTHSSGDTFPVGVTTVTYTATDIHGNVSTSSFDVDVDDTENPVFTTVAQDLTVECDGNGNTASLNTWLAAFGGSVAEDNCGIYSVFNDYDVANMTDECGLTGATLVTFTATDIYGNTSTTSATFTIEDTTPPTFMPNGGSVTVECDGTGNVAEIDAWLNLVNSSTASDVCGGVTIEKTTTLLTDDCAATGTASVNFLITDDCGNQVDTTLTFTIEDTTGPQFLTTAADETVECDGAGNTAALQTWLDNHGGATAEDACGDFTWSNDFDALSDDCGETGSRTVTFTATDECGNESHTSATFTIEDTTAPTIASEAMDMTVECDGAGNTAQLNAWLAANGNAGAASDICSGVTWSNDFTSLSDLCGATGSATVIFTASDDCGNTTSTTATFTIEDTTDPAIASPAMDMTVECDGNGNTAELNAWLAANGNAGEATDACSDPVIASIAMSASDLMATVPNPNWDRVATLTLQSDPNSNQEQTLDINITSMPAGARYRVLKTTANGNWYVSPPQNLDLGMNSITVSAVTFQRTVKVQFSDEETEFNSLVINGAQLLNPSLLTGSSDLFSQGPSAWPYVFTAATLADPDGGDQQVLEINVLSLPSGGANYRVVKTTANGNWYNGPAQALSLGSNAIYTNAVSFQRAVKFQFDSGDIEFDSFVLNGEEQITGGVTWSNDFTALSDDCGATGSATVTFTATDACGNTSSTTATFTIEDTTNPSMDVESADMTVECDGAGNPTELNAWLSSNGGASASDQCSGVTWSNDFTSLSDLCGATGAATVTFTATDDCGLSTSTTATFTIEDTTAPVLTGDEVVIIDCSAWPWEPLYQPTIDELLTVVDTAGNPIITLDEACGYTNFPIDFDVMSGGCNYDHQLVYYPVDDCGNEGDSLYQVIQVDDFTDPVFTSVPADTMIACTEDVMAYFEMAAAEDACDPSVDLTFEDEIIPTACPEEYTIRRTFYAEDCGYNIATAIQNITVADTAAPTLALTAPAHMAVNGCLSSADLSEAAMGSVSWTTSDDCGDVLVTYTTSDANAFSCAGDDAADEGSYVVTRTFTVTATDCAGNSTTESIDQTITITDDAAPTVSLDAPADETVYLDASCYAAPLATPVSGDASGFLVTATDNCDSDVSHTITVSDDTTYTGIADGVGSYDILRTYTVTVVDDCGNEASATTSHTISVLDEIAPDVTGTFPADIIIYADDDNGYFDPTPLNTGGASADYSDNCSGAGDQTYGVAGQVPTGGLIITAIGDPNDAASTCRFVEIHNSGDGDIDLAGYALQRWTNGNAGPSTSSNINLSSIGTLAPGQYAWIANNAGFEGCYGFAPTLIGGTGGPADSNGDDQIAIIDGASNIIDMFGVAGEDGSHTCHEFEDGIALRAGSNTDPNGGAWDESGWIVYSDFSNASGCTNHNSNQPQNASDIALLINNWAGAGPAAPETDFNSVDISYADVTTSYTASACYTFERTWTITVTDNNGNATTVTDVQTIQVADTSAPDITALENTVASCDLFGFDLSAGDQSTVLAYTSFEEGASGDQYVDTGDAAADHALANNPGQSDVNFTSTGGEMGFSSYYYSTGSNGLTDGDYVGVTSFTGAVGAFTDGSQGFQMQDTDGIMEVVFDNVDVSMGGVTLTLDYFPQSTGWETGDRIRIWVVADGGEIDLVDTDYQDIDVLGIEGQWNLATLDLDGFDDAELHISLESNSGSEGLFIDNILFSAGNSPLAALEANGYVSFSDNVELASTEAAITLDGTPCEGAYDIVYTATDSCGNVTTAMQRIVLEDTEAPMLTVETPEAVTLSADADCFADYVDGVPYPTASATDNCDDDVEITAFHFDGTKQYACLPSTGAFTVLRTYEFTATDNCGNTTTTQVTRLVTVVDDTAPTFTATAPADKTVNIDPFCGANTSTTIAGMPTVTDAEDNCDSSVDIEIEHTDSAPVYTCDGSDSAAEGSYTFVRTFTITGTDDCGNETVQTVTQNITALDVTAPTITGLPPMGTANHTLDADCFADLAPTASPMAMAMDACDSDVAITSTYADSAPTYTCDGGDGEAEGSFTFTRTWTVTATDDCGNSTSQMISQTVVVSDDTAPSLSATWPADYTTDLDADCNADLTPAAAGAATANGEDGCDSDVTIEISSEDGAITYMAVNVDDVAEGGYFFTRTWTATATDDCGNSTSETHDQLITANDVTAPTQELETLPTYTVEGCYGEVDLDPSVTGTPTVSAEDGCDSDVDIDLTYSTDDLVFNEVVGDYSLVIDTISGPEDGVLGMTTVRLYIETENEDDFISAVAGDEINPTGIRTTTSFYQNIFGGATANTYNDGLTLADPLVAFDSWVTIGIDEQPDGTAGEVETTVVGDWQTDFEMGGDLLINDFFGGSWFTTTPNTAAVAGPDHRVLLGQFTTDGQMSGQMFVQVFPNGSGADEMRISFTFGDCAEDDDTPEGSYAFTRRWESVVTDDADNSSTAVTYQHIQVLDTEAPQLTNTCGLNNGETVAYDCPGIGVLDFDPVPVACDVTAIDNCDSEVNVTLFTETEGYIPTDDIRNYCAPVTPEAQSGSQTCDDRAPEVIRLFNFPGADDSFVMADAENLVQVMADGSMHIELEVENADGTGGFTFTADYGAGQDWATWSAGGSNYKKDCAEIYPGENIWEDWVYFMMTSGTLEGTGMYSGSSFTLSHQPANGYYGMQMGLGANNKNANYGGSAWFFWQGDLVVDGVDMGPMASSGDVYMDLDCCLEWSVDYYYTAIDDCGNPTGFTYSEAMGAGLEDGDATASGGHTDGPVDITSVGGIKEPIRITGLAPNPTNDMSQLSFVVSENMRLRVDLYTMSGTLVQELYEGNAVTGVQYVMDIDADALSDGMYQVRISSNSYLAVKKLLVAN